MKLISNKIRSSCGASMIIAMVFMLVAVFVGGSVLVAATVNGNRVTKDRKTQQSILNQRSACSVFAELLAGESGKPDVSLEYDAGSNAYINTYNPDGSAEDSLKYIVCEAARNAINNVNDGKKAFNITDPEGNVLNCEAVCKISGSEYTVYLQFKENPQVQLKLLGRKEGNSISWYSGRIIKAELL